MSAIDAVLENRLLSGWTRHLPRDPERQVGGIHETDAELVRLGNGDLLALTIDTVDEEIDAGLYADPATAGRMAAVAALSDLAAVGAAPLGLLLSVTLPGPDRDRVITRDAVALGVAAAARAAGVHVLGGDTSEGPVLRVACVGAGLVPATTALRRTGLQPGDRLFVSGRLGAGAALAAGKLLGIDGAADEARFHPPPRIAHGQALRGIARGCIDTSDGLVAAVDQLARVNGRAIDVDVELASLLSPEAEEARRSLGCSAFSFLASLHGEFELVFGVPPARLDALSGAATALDWRPIPIGHVREGHGLSLGGRSLDGARIRNLFHETDRDVRRYLAALEALAAEHVRGSESTGRSATADAPARGTRTSSA